jgi:hypothetical protein
MIPLLLLFRFLWISCRYLRNKNAAGNVLPKVNYSTSFFCFAVTLKLFFETGMVFEGNSNNNLEKEPLFIAFNHSGRHLAKEISTMPQKIRRCEKKEMLASEKEMKRF